MTITSETLRRAGVIADKIEDGTLFRSGILSRAQLAETVRAVISAALTSKAAGPATSTAPAKG